MKYLTPEIGRLAKRHSKIGHSGKSLVRPGVSCGIFQDCHDTTTEYTNKFFEFNKKKNAKTSKGLASSSSSSF